jgi:hypothetical protein
MNVIERFEFVRDKSPKFPFDPTTDRSEFPTVIMRSKHSNIRRFSPERIDDRVKLGWNLFLQASSRSNVDTGVRRYLTECYIINVKKLSGYAFGCLHDYIG